MSTPVLTEWVTAQQVANHLQVSLGWIRKLTQNGSLPHHKIGRRVRYTLAEVDRWVADGANTGGL